MEEQSSTGRVRVSGRKDGGVQAPIDLGGLFGGSDDENDDSDVKAGSFENTSELQTLVVGDRKISVRQYSWHEANANQVWPGTFVLAEFLTAHKDRYNKSCLELGSATGALAIYLRPRWDRATFITDSDIDDGGLVMNNIAYNTELNGLPRVPHIPHTWGTGWADSVAALSEAERNALAAYVPFRYVIASDILLYVSAYPSLVATLRELFTGDEEVVEFVMAWNRRISASGAFFDLMKEAGFLCHHHGHCVFSFYTAEGASRDHYLQGLCDGGKDGDKVDASRS